MNSFMRMSDGRSSVVYYVTDRQHPVDHGNGDVRVEESECTLCDRWVGHGWFEWIGDVPVTCIACLADAFRYFAPKYALISVRNGRITGGTC